MTVNERRRRPCPISCACLCHDLNGGPMHPGRPCPGKAVNERPRAEITDAPYMRDNRLFIAETTDYPISGDKIAVFLDDPGHGRVRRMELGDLLWPRVRGEVSP